MDEMRMGSNSMACPSKLLYVALLAGQYMRVGQRKRTRKGIGTRRESEQVGPS